MDHVIRLLANNALSEVILQLELSYPNSCTIIKQSDKIL